MNKTINILAILLLFLFSGLVAYSAAPLKNADVTITCSNGKTLTARTDASGSFSVSVADLDCDGFTLSAKTEVLSWSWGTSNSGSMSSGSGGGSGKVSMQDFHFVARDAASGQASGQRDASSGLATGKRQHGAVTIVKTTLCPNGQCSSGTCNIDLTCDGSTLSGKMMLDAQAARTAGYDLKKMTK